MAEVASWTVNDQVSDLKTVAEITESTFPVTFLTLQKLSKVWGQTKLLEAFEASCVKLMDHMPEGDKSDTKLAKVLEEHDLAFLMPLLTLQQVITCAQCGNFEIWLSFRFYVKSILRILE